MKIFLLIASLSMTAPSFADTPAPRCPWADTTDQLRIDASEGRDMTASIRGLLPNLGSHLDLDSKLESVKQLWGTSINFDVNARDIIVDNSIIDSLLAQVGVAPRDNRYVHAGVEHTYGYLFSTLLTPYGYKCARWVQNEMEDGLGLSAGLLGSNPSHGTLLANATQLFGRIALSDSTEAIRLVQADRASAAPEIMVWTSGARPAVVRLAEGLTVTRADGSVRRVELRSDFVQFNGVSRNGNAHLLIYSISDSADGGVSKLITAFPVADAFVTTALNPAALGDNQKIITRYNAFVRGVTDSTASWLGTRSVKTTPAFCGAR